MEHIELTNQHLTRQLDHIPMCTLGMPITIIGAGAIGSFAALQLAKMGCADITVWDHDSVSIENMSCQFYRFKDIGKPKVGALAEIVAEFTLQGITPNHCKWAPDKQTKGIVILAVDCMEARKAIWETIKKTCFQVKFVIDPRMSIEDALLYCMNPFDQKDVKSYEKTLYSNKEAAQERCTAKSTVYTANLLSGLVVKTVKNIICGQPYPRTTQWSIGMNDLNVGASQ